MLEHSTFGWPLIIAGVLKTTYDLALLAMFHDVRPPEEQTPPSGRKVTAWHGSNRPASPGMGEHVDWSLHRTEMAIGMGKFSEAVYGNSRLPLREREAARWTIALINDCVVCQDTRAKDAQAHAVDEGFYAEVAAWATTDALTEREKLAAEFAQRFALDHQAHGRRVLGPPARRVQRRRGGRPHHLLRDVPRPRAGAWRWSACRPRDERILV